MIHDVRANCDEAKLLGSIHNISGTMLLLLLNSLHVKLIQLHLILIVVVLVHVIVDFQVLIIYCLGNG